MAILRVLWGRGPTSVRDVHNALLQSRPTGYSTTLKMMQVMFDKGLLTRDQSQRPQLYAPAIPEEQTQKQIVDDILQRVFGGSARKLALARCPIRERHLARTGRNPKTAQATGRRQAMTLIQSLLESSYTQRLGLTLLHSLWQGAAVALVLIVLQRLARNAAVASWR